jgi:PRTRC genetic system protein A
MVKGEQNMAKKNQNNGFTDSELQAINELRNQINNSHVLQIGTYTFQPGVNSTTLIQNDGIYTVKETDLARFVIKEVSYDFKGIVNGEYQKEGIQLKVPKVPAKMFLDILEWFRVVYQKYKTEVYVRIYWNKIRQEFFFWIPKQIISGALVEWDIEHDNFPSDKDNILVVQAHSHHTMTGRFSAVDDADHRNLESIHLVIGDIFKIYPTYQIRFALGNKKVDLNLEDVFEPLWKHEFDITMFGDYENKLSNRLYENRVNEWLANNNDYKTKDRVIQGDLFDDEIISTRPIYGDPPASESIHTYLDPMQYGFGYEDYYKNRRR